MVLLAGVSEQRLNPCARDRKALKACSSVGSDDAPPVEDGLFLSRWQH